MDQIRLSAIINVTIQKNFLVTHLLILYPVCNNTEDLQQLLQPVKAHPTLLVHPLLRTGMKTKTQQPIELLHLIHLNPPQSADLRPSPLTHHSQHIILNLN